MKKIVIPFDGGHFSKGAFSFASSLHEKKAILLTGIFLPEVDYARFIFFPTAFAAPVFMAGVEDFEEEEVNNNVEMFAELCQKNLIEYRVHKDLFDSIPQLSKETRFADLMIIGSETFYTNGIVNGTNEYLKDALHSTECPVVIVPEKFDFPSNIILAYDGSASSVFAIKQFANLFPELCNLKTILVYVCNENHNMPDQVLIEELVARHFSNLTVTKKITSDNKNDISNWFSQLKNSLVVSGSFGRSGISELFKKSFLIELIKEHSTPVFIAHI